MAQPFTGENVHKMDKKGRASVPASYRRVLMEGQDGYTMGDAYHMMLLTSSRGGRKYLEGFTMDRMLQINAMIKRLPPFSKKREYLERALLMKAEQVTVEISGRFVIPEKMRKKVELEEGEIVFAGLGERFQIWTPEALEADFEALEAEFEEASEEEHPLAMLEEWTAELPTSGDA